MTTRVFRSLRVQIGLAVVAIFLVLTATLTFTLHALKLRQHDYLILNLTGQLRVVSQTMMDQAKHYAGQAPDDYEKYDRDLGTYWQDLQKQTALFSQIVSGLETRQIDAGLAGGGTHHGKIYCTWDEQSRLQMRKTAADWKHFKTGLDARIGDNRQEPRLTWAAEYIAANGDTLVASSETLSRAFQFMMEQKLNELRLFQWAAGSVGLLLLLLVMWMVQRLVIRPINTTLAGFDHIAQGNFGHQVPVLEGNEIGRMAAAFNRLAGRLNSLFRLTDRINQGNKLDEMLSFVLEEFKGFVPLDWVGVFFASPDGTHLVLERQAGIPIGLNNGAGFDRSLGELALMGNQPHMFTLGQDTPASSLENALRTQNMQSTVFLPLPSDGGKLAVMVFASGNRAYQPQHAEFLNNIGSTIGHVLEKTVVMENLVASAVQGLAKLAESRDPETGDHLVRMALYSALIAEELGMEGPFAGIITPAYIRDVFHFAPMHDIGKVGVRDDVLLKPGRLDGDERKEMERHPTIGGEVLRRCEAQMEALGHSMFRTGIEIAECHHEKYDGTGYPAGLKAQEIPLSARIVAVADVFDALTSKRPYKDAWPVDKALNVMQEDAGKHFDPDVIAAMMRSLPRMMEIYDRMKHV